MAEEKKLNILEENTNEENIQDVIAKAGIVTEEIVSAAAEKIAARRKEKVTQELIEVVQRCEYTKQSTYLQYRRSNKINKKIKAYLKDLTELTDSITNGKEPIQNFEKKATELKHQLDKDLIEIGREMDEAHNQLREIFPNSWSYGFSSLIPKRSN